MNGEMYVFFKEIDVFLCATPKSVVFFFYRARPAVAVRSSERRIA